MRRSQPTLFRRETLNVVSRVRAGSASSSDNDSDDGDFQQQLDLEEHVPTASPTELDEFSDFDDLLDQ